MLKDTHANKNKAHANEKKVLEEKLFQMKEMHAGVLEELRVTKEARACVEETHSVCANEKEAVQEELLQMKATHAGVLEDLRLTKEAMTKATEELQEEKKAQSECAQAESRLQEELDAEKKAHSECTDEKKALQSRVQEQGSQMEADAAQIAKLLAKMDLLKKESEEALGALQVQMDKACDERCAAEVRDALAKSEEEHTRVLEEEQARMQKDVDKLSANDMDDATRIATLEDQLAALKSVYSSTKQELIVFKEAHAPCAKVRTTLQAELREANGALKAGIEDREALREHLHVKEKELEALQKEMDKDKAEHARLLEEEKTRMQKEVEHLSANDLEDATRISKLEKEVPTIQDPWHLHRCMCGSWVCQMLTLRPGLTLRVGLTLNLGLSVPTQPITTYH